MRQLALARIRFLGLEPGPLLIPIKKGTFLPNEKNIPGCFIALLASCYMVTLCTGFSIDYLVFSFSFPKMKKDALPNEITSLIDYCRPGIRYTQMTLRTTLEWFKSMALYFSVSVPPICNSVITGGLPSVGDLYPQSFSVA